MSNGLFSQGMAVLFDATPKMDTIASALDADFSPTQQLPPRSTAHIGGPGIILDAGLKTPIEVDIFDQVWPDSIDESDRELVDAWKQGCFSPHATPGALERAVLHSAPWDGAHDAVSRHTACIRLRLGPDRGAANEVTDLTRMTRVARRLLDIPGALALFAPGGDMLVDAEGLSEMLTVAEKHDIVPFDVWSNSRAFRVDDEWAVMDVVGNAQIGLPDAEIIFPHQDVDATDAAGYLRGVTAYMLEKGPIFQAGDTANGPGGSYLVHPFLVSLAPPSREVFCFAPGFRAPPDSLLQRPGTGGAA